MDRDLDGNVDLVYIADMSGDLWRFDTRQDPDPTVWSSSKLFDGSDPITANPVTALGENGKIWVYFGTGAYVDDDDMVSDGQQYFYAVADVHDGGTATYKNLTDQTTNPGAIDNNDRGWYVELWGAPGERVIEQAVVVAENVIFTSFAPSLDACVAGGESWLYQMAYDTGNNPKSEEGNSGRHAPDLPGRRRGVVPGGRPRPGQGGGPVQRCQHQDRGHRRGHQDA